MMRIGLMVIGALVFASCSRGARPPADTTPATTAVQVVEATGRVVEVGADPATWLALEPIGGGAQTRLSGPGAALLRSVSGAVVWVSGQRAADNDIRVDVFEVRRIGDRDVDDGIVVATTNGVELRSRSGATRPVPNATPALRDIAGARVWLSRPVAGVTPSYGVIAPKP